MVVEKAEADSSTSEDEGTACDLKSDISFRMEPLLPPPHASSGNTARVLDLTVRKDISTFPVNDRLNDNKSSHRDGLVAPRGGLTESGRPNCCVAAHNSQINTRCTSITNQSCWNLLKTGSERQTLQDSLLTEKCVPVATNMATETYSNFQENIAKTATRPFTYLTPASQDIVMQQASEPNVIRPFPLEKDPSIRIKRAYDVRKIMAALANSKGHQKLLGHQNCGVTSPEVKIKMAMEAMVNVKKMGLWKLALVTKQLARKNKLLAFQLVQMEKKVAILQGYSDNRSVKSS